MCFICSARNISMIAYGKLFKYSIYNALYCTCKWWIAYFHILAKSKLAIWYASQYVNKQCWHIFVDIFLVMAFLCVDIMDTQQNANRRCILFVLYVMLWKWSFPPSLFWSAIMLKDILFPHVVQNSLSFISRATGLWLIRVRAKSTASICEEHGVLILPLERGHTLTYHLQ